MTFDRSKPMEAQVELFAENLAQRLANDRAEAAARGARDAASAVAED